jgi:hypothetical protein
MQQLEAHELPLRIVFSVDYHFEIPHYQRPYSWEISHAAQLLDDLRDALDRDSAEPYFLGSVVLVKQRHESPDAEVIDGQQRLTTLTVLFAVLAELADNPALSEQYRRFISEPGDILLGREAKPRLEVRLKDRDFFRRYVQTAGRLGDLLDLPDSALATDSQKAVRDNARQLHDLLLGWEPERRLLLGQLLAQRTYLVVVSTPDLASAHRIFSVLNARGLSLMPADVLKSDVIGQIRAGSREDYARKWEDAEQNLGRAEFGNLLLDIRMIFGKRRPQEALLKEFPRQVLARFGPGRMHDFIDDEIVPLSRSYCEIRDARYAPADPESGEINASFRRLAQLDNRDWRAPALWALRYRHDDRKFVYQFMDKLERLAASMFIRRVYTSPRVDRYARLLTELDGGAGLDAPAFELGKDEIVQTVNVLNGDIYGASPRVRRYVLLRLEELISAAGNPVFQPGTVTIEHVLPQHPRLDAAWRTLFTDGERALWTNRLANLVLLNRMKNSAASTLEFEEKKKKYFGGQTGVTTFALTVEVLNEPSWTPRVLEQRQSRLLSALMEAWQLN